MADILNVYQICPKCKGTGEVEESAAKDNDEVVSTMTVCPVCNGEAELLWGRIKEEEE